MGNTYQFRALTKEEAAQVDMGGSSNIRSIKAISQDFGNDCAKIYGNLITLFGQPLYQSADLENQYEYCVEAKDPNGNVLYLSAYSGPSGPAIGGFHGPQASRAADELADFILNAEPADYDYSGIYMDGPCKVEMGVKHGQPYWNETELEMTEGDWEKFTF